MTDALGQTKQFSYAKDDRVAGITYVNAVNSTPNVSFAYDSYFPRLVSMTDGTGTTQYSYVPIGSPGALQLAQESSPLPGSAITYAYDPLGRTASRAVAGSGAETFQYDTINRLSGYTNDLGAFTLSYLGQTGQVTQRQLAGSTLATTWTYLANSGDRRLSGISHVGLSASNVSAWQFASTPEDFIIGVTETSDAATVYPTVGQQTAAFNPLNQLTSLSAQTALTYSATGNLLSDGQRVFAWDAEDRLVGITWPAQPGKQVTFAYDGLSRRTTISSTPAGGGGTVTTSYVWCGASLCQMRNAANTLTRAYFDEGEIIPGAPAQSLYYGADQIGSVRRVFASTGSAPAYAYDPYGVALQGTAPLTDFGFAGMFWHADSGLYLTQYRAYDATLGRWLSRDPLGEGADPGGNLYAYVGGQPTRYVDPRGANVVAAGLAGGKFGGMIGASAGTAILPGPGTVIGGAAGVVVGAVAGVTIFVGGVILFDHLLSPPPPTDTSNLGSTVVQSRGLPPEGVTPPVEGVCKPGPASRPSEQAKGGQSLWDEKGGEWRWFPGDKWHNPHWDHNPHDRPNAPWQNVPHGGLPPVKPP